MTTTTIPRTETSNSFTFTEAASTSTASITSPTTHKNFTLSSTINTTEPTTNAPPSSEGPSGPGNFIFFGALAIIVFVLIIAAAVGAIILCILSRRRFAKSTIVFAPHIDNLHLGKGDFSGSLDGQLDNSKHLINIDRDLRNSSAVAGLENMTTESFIMRMRKIFARALMRRQNFAARSSNKNKNSANAN